MSELSTNVVTLLFNSEGVRAYINDKSRIVVEGNGRAHSLDIDTYKEKFREPGHFMEVLAPAILGAMYYPLELAAMHVAEHFADSAA